MPNWPDSPRWTYDPWIAERATVLQLLRNDHEVRWSFAELEAKACDVAPAALADALGRLEQHGVVVACGEYLVASRCARHLDALGMVGV
jgi:hypothetical protein